MKIEGTIKQLESILDHTRSMAAEADADEIWKEDIAALEFAITALRSMPEAGEPLSLEQLKQMDGKPVWIVEYPDWGHWELSEDAEDYLCDRDTELYGLTYPDPDGKAGLHKLGWLAYAYPPVHIDRGEWISVKERLPDDEKDGETVLAIVSGKPHKNITLCHALMTAGYFPGEGWVVNEYPEWENPTITHWMPLPEPPEEG